MLAHVAGVWYQSVCAWTACTKPGSIEGEHTPDSKTHSMVSPSFNGLRKGVISPLIPSGPAKSARALRSSEVAESCRIEHGCLLKRTERIEIVGMDDVADSIRFTHPAESAEYA